MSVTGKVIGGFLIGAGVGTVAALLMAPASGRKTRNQIVEETKRLKDQVTEAINDSLKNIKSGYNRKVEEYAAESKASVDRAKEKAKVS